MKKLCIILFLFLSIQLHAVGLFPLFSFGLSVYDSPPDELNIEEGELIYITEFRRQRPVFKFRKRRFVFKFPGGYGRYLSAIIAEKEINRPIFGEINKVIKTQRRLLYAGVGSFAFSAVGLGISPFTLGMGVMCTDSGSEEGYAIYDGLILGTSLAICIPVPIFLTLLISSGALNRKIDKNMMLAVNQFNGGQLLFDTRNFIEPPTPFFYTDYKGKSDFSFSWQGEPIRSGFFGIGKPILKELSSQEDAMPYVNRYFDRSRAAGALMILSGVFLGGGVGTAVSLDRGSLNSSLTGTFLGLGSLSLLISSILYETQKPYAVMAIAEYNGGILTYKAIEK